MEATRSKSLQKMPNFLRKRLAILRSIAEDPKHELRVREELSNNLHKDKVVEWSSNATA